MSQIKVFTLRPDSTTEEQTIDRADFLKVAQAAVGGLIQPVDLTPTLTMYVNEEFLYSGEEANPVASYLFASIGAEYRILGSVIFTGGVDDEGDTQGLTDAHVFALKSLADLNAPTL